SSRARGFFHHYSFICMGRAQFFSAIRAGKTDSPAPASPIVKNRWAGMLILPTVASSRKSRLGFQKEKAPPKRGQEVRIIMPVHVRGATSPNWGGGRLCLTA